MRRDHVTQVPQAAGVCGKEGQVELWRLPLAAVFRMHEPQKCPVLRARLCPQELVLPLDL